MGETKRQEDLPGEQMLQGEKIETEQEKPFDIETLLTRIPSKEDKAKIKKMRDEAKAEYRGDDSSLDSPYSIDWWKSKNKNEAVQTALDKKVHGKMLLDLGGGQGSIQHILEDRGGCY